MIHPHELEGARPLGDTGLFVGGFVSALDLVEEGGAKPGDFKFFFNHLAWPAGALQEQVRERRQSSGRQGTIWLTGKFFVWVVSHYLRICCLSICAFHLCCLGSKGYFGAACLPCSWRNWISPFRRLRVRC